MLESDCNNENKEGEWDEVGKRMRRRRMAERNDGSEGSGVGGDQDG